jgi:hypothetical protein
VGGPPEEYELRLEIVSRSQEPVRRIAKQAGQMADPVERLRYLRGLLRMVPRNHRWGFPRSWPPVMVVLAGLATVATAILMWREF